MNSFQVIPPQNPGVILQVTRRGWDWHVCQVGCDASWEADKLVEKAIAAWVRHYVPEIT